MEQMSRPARQPTPGLGPIRVLRSELVCTARTLVMLLRGELAMPRTHVGRVIHFDDDSRSTIYRETVLRGSGRDRPLLLVVRFRLKWIGNNHLAHALFRAESLLNTVLFAAHAGFRTKLWCTDRETGLYRGIYEWEGLASAERYAETLRVVLRPWVTPESFAYQIIENVSREDFMNGRLTRDLNGVGDGWFSPMGFQAIGGSSDD